MVYAFDDRELLFLFGTTACYGKKVTAQDRQAARAFSTYFAKRIGRTKDPTTAALSKAPRGPSWHGHAAQDRLG
jgi:hypothetical protein